MCRLYMCNMYYMHSAHLVHWLIDWLIYLAGNLETTKMKYRLDEGLFYGSYLKWYIVSGSVAPTCHPQSLHVALFTYICMALTFCHTCSSIMHITFHHTLSTIHAAYWDPYQPNLVPGISAEHYTWLATIYLLEEHAILGYIEAL